MNQLNSNKSILHFIENLELVGINFIRGYIQFLFDGSVLTTYTLPLIKFESKIITSTEFGFYDALCRLIGEKISLAYEDEKEEKMMIKFERGVELVVSLKSEDRNCAEAAMLQLEIGGKWNVW